MSVVEAFKIIDSLEDIFIDYRGMNTKEVVKSLRRLRLEIADELSSKSVLIDEPLTVPHIEETKQPEPPKPMSLANSSISEAKITVLNSSNGFPEFIKNVQSVFGLSNRELGKTIGYSEATISLWKSGKCEIRKDYRSIACRNLESVYHIPIEVSRKFIKC